VPARGRASGTSLLLQVSIGREVLWWNSRSFYFG